MIIFLTLYIFIILGLSISAFGENSLFCEISIFGSLFFLWNFAQNIRRNIGLILTKFRQKFWQLFHFLAKFQQKKIVKIFGQIWPKSEISQKSEISLKAEGKAYYVEIFFGFFLGGPCYDTVFYEGIPSSTFIFCLFICFLQNKTAAVFYFLCTLVEFEMRFWNKVKMW